MTELLLHMNNDSITGVITAYQTYPKWSNKKKKKMKSYDEFSVVNHPNIYMVFVKHFFSF